jgi:hypothetical protein
MELSSNRTLFDDGAHDHHHVYGVTLRLWTVATIHLVKYERGEPWWIDSDWVKLLIRPPELCGNYTSRAT